MSDEPRKYRKLERARQEEETRRRITEAVVELHRTVGPARTKVTEVAERAGVSRMTVYNHFPTEADLVGACSAHWAAANPLPDPGSWTTIEDPRTRLHAALTELYRFYGEGEDMLGNVLRDAPVVEPLGAIMEERWAPYMKGVVEVLSEGWSGDEGLFAALRVAIDFRTWRLLDRSMPDLDAAVGVAVRMVAGASQPWKDDLGEPLATGRTPPARSQW